jgi:hypothetical protein
MCDPDLIAVIRMDVFYAGYRTCLGTRAMMLRELGGVVGPRFEGLGVTVQGLSTPRTHLDATVYAVAKRRVTFIMIMERRLMLKLFSCGSDD